MGSAFSVLAYKNAVNEADIEEINKPRAAKKIQNVESTSVPVIHDCAQSIKQENEGKVFANPVQLPTSAITWSFFPPTEKWQEEVCTTNKLDYICKIDYAGRGSTLNQFTSPSLSHILDVMGDGNCLFRAISVVITGAEKSHPIIRKQICDHMLQTNSKVNGKAPSEYLKTSKMEQNAVWGTTDEILVASSWFKVPTYVWHWFGKKLCWHCHDLLKLGRKTDNAIYLGNASGNHFQIVIGFEMHFDFNIFQPFCKYLCFNEKRRTYLAGLHVPKKRFFFAVRFKRLFFFS